MMRKILCTVCGILLLAGLMMAFAQNDSAPMPTGAITTTTATPTSLVNITANLVNVTATNATIPQPPSPPSLGGLVIIFGVMVLIVLVPIAIFAWYNKKTLENVLKENGQLPETKRESVSTLIKALIPPEPLGMPNGSVRAIFAIIGIGIFAYAVYTFSESRTELVAALITLVSSITGFYFGARATEDIRKSSPTQPTPVLTTITVLPATASVVAGNTQTFTASPKDQFGNPINATVTWSSSDISVGTITDAGVFTAKAAGATTITATSDSVSGIATVTVVTLPSPSK